MAKWALFPIIPWQIKQILETMPESQLSQGEKRGAPWTAHQSSIWKFEEERKFFRNDLKQIKEDFTAQSAVPAKDHGRQKK